MSKVVAEQAKVRGIARIVKKDGTVTELKIVDVEELEQEEAADADQRQHDPE